VTDAGRGSGVSIVRSLGRRGIHVVAADTGPRSPGFFSRYAAGHVTYPPTRTQPEAAVAALLQAARDHRIDLVLPVGEDCVVLLSRARASFPTGITLALPEREALGVARDKLATLDLARRLDVPVPRTQLVSTAADALRHAPELGWPVVLKPQASLVLRENERVDAFGVTYATDPATLAEQMRSFEGKCSVLLQEYCGGEGHGMGMLMKAGKPLLAFQHRRLREVPFTGGPSSFRESVELDPALFDYSVRLLGAMNWTGPAMVEFKVGGSGVKLMEINGRLWGSLPLAIKSGVDVPNRLVELYLSGSGPAMDGPTTSYAVGVRSRDLALELAWIASVLGPRPTGSFVAPPPRRQALAAALRLLHPRDGFDVLALEDPRPGLVELANTAVKAAGRLVRRTYPATSKPTTDRHGLPGASR
jgi:predicted ATP-grasp superfamily ATP-dependent carboligase